MCITSRGVCRLLCVCFLGWMAVPAAADLYQCRLADGSVVFSDAVCAEGYAEPLVLLENTALDSTAERNNIERYNSPEARRQRERQKPAPQALLIRDSATAERNARISQETRKPKKKTGKKTNKKTLQKKKSQKKKTKKIRKQNTGKTDPKTDTEKT